MSAENGHTNIIFALIAKKADANKPDNNVRTPLFYSANIGDCKAVLELINNGGAKVDQRCDRKYTPLMWAAFGQDHSAVVDALLSKGADINAQNHAQETALMLAARSNRSAVVSALLAADANLALINGDGETALMLAAQMKHAVTVSTILSVMPFKRVTQLKAHPTLGSFATTFCHETSVRLNTTTQFFCENTTLIPPHKNGPMSIILSYMRAKDYQPSLISSLEIISLSSESEGEEEDGWKLGLFEVRRALGSIIGLEPDERMEASCDKVTVPTSAGTVLWRSCNGLGKSLSEMTVSSTWPARHFLRVCSRLGVYTCQDNPNEIRRAI